jgi:hypothetical protein
MNDYSSTERRSVFGFGAGLAVLAVAFTLGSSRPARAERVDPPPVPADIQVPAGNRAFLVGHAEGTQNYMCLPSGNAVAWKLLGPQATLFDDDWKQISTHFASVNPAEPAGTPLRATWQHSRDTSGVWATMIKQVPGAPNAIAWLLLRTFPGYVGKTGGRKLTATTYIQRVNTTGGVMPATGCAVPSDIGKLEVIPYTADYYFYKAIDDDDDEEEDSRD